MPISKPEAKQLLERLIFDDSSAQDWVQDVWGLSPTLGETAATLVDVFEVLADTCSEADLEAVLQQCYHAQIDSSSQG